MKFVAYFEFFGKKMKTEIEADDAEQAKKIISNKIIFHKVVVKSITDDDMLNHLKNIFGM